ncbi:hypothetical protein HXX76_014246 [Chlamydomonas incerta]|uniref:Pherophorin domain-containing protein n=1 Tax=Chlamydomonas incerta TaxID=51695 RepID=A0A835VR94_CHLIN|nr:hypothetical protein HXX76_014246 [Chlamydomonas incerta]|eukprot:KAG2424825.1 hypothetical protein HXX76_014246 [Chlamydomonas incerta]
MAKSAGRVSVVVFAVLSGFPYLSCGQPAATCADSGVQLRAVSIERQEVAAPGNTALLVAFPSICFRLRLRPGAASAAAGSCAAAAVAGGLQELRLWTAGDASAAGVTATVRGVPVPVSSVPAPAGASDALGGYVLVVPLAAALSAADLAGGNATLCLRLPPPYVSAATGAAASIMGLLAREEAPLITEKRPDTWPRWDQTLSTEVRSVRLAYGLVAAGAACCPGPCTDAVVWYQSRCSRLISGEACAVVDRVAAAGNYAPFYRAVLAQTCLEAATSDCSFPLTGALLDSFAQLNPQGCVRCTDPGAAPAPNNPFPWCGPLGANIQPRLFYCVA